MKNTLISVALLILVIAVVGVGIFSAKKNRALRSSEQISVTGMPERTTTGTVSSQESPYDGMAIPLVVSNPVSGATVSSDQVVVRGQTKAAAEVFVNDKQLVADANGNFSLTVTLDEGENFILVTAVDSDGNAKEQEITVMYDVGS